ncbi:MAG: Flp family type IVb pilin [Bacillota bacterium]
MLRMVKRLLRGQEGQSLTEYALILALIAVVAISVLTGVGQKIVQKLTNVSNALQ